MVEKQTSKIRMNLKTLLDNNEPVWVENMSGRGWVPKGKTEWYPCVITVTVGAPPNHMKLIVPGGADPVCLTDQVDSSFLRTSNDLFRMISSGALKLLDPNCAEEYYLKNEERRAVIEQKIDDVRRHVIDDSHAATDEGKAQDIKINDMVLNLCLQSKHGDIKEDKVYEKIFEKIAVLSEDDLSYMLVNMKFSSVKKLVKKEIEKRAK